MANCEIIPDSGSLAAISGLDIHRSLNGGSAGIKQTAKWVLTQAQVVNPGKSTDTENGLLITGYEMRAPAQAQGPATGS